MNNLFKDFIYYDDISDPYYDLLSVFPYFSFETIIEQISSLNRIFAYKNNGDPILIKYKNIPWMLCVDDVITKDIAIIPFFADCVYGNQFYMENYSYLFTENLPGFFAIPYLSSSELPETFKDFIYNHCDKRSNLQRLFYGEKSKRISYTVINGSHLQDNPSLYLEMLEIANQHDLDFLSEHKEINAFEYVLPYFIQSTKDMNYILALVDEKIVGFYAFTLFKYDKEGLKNEIKMSRLAFSHEDIHKTFYLAGYLHAAIVKHYFYSDGEDLSPKCSIINFGVNDHDVAQYKNNLFADMKSLPIKGISLSTFHKYASKESLCD